jgi:hypothetical protein
LNKVSDPGFGFASRVFGWCVGIVESALVSAGLPCWWVSIYLKAIGPGLVPVAIDGVDKAVSIPVVAFIAYIDTVLPPSLAT